MSKTNIKKVKNNSGAKISAGKVVYITGYDDEDKQPTIDLASYTDINKTPALGIIREDANNGDKDITVIVSGPVIGYDTSGHSPNTEVYLGSNGDVIFDLDTTNINNDLIYQQLGVTLNQKESPDGQIQLYPLEMRHKYYHIELLEVLPDQHHNKLHAEKHKPNEEDQFIHANQHISNDLDPLFGVVPIKGITQAYLTAVEISANFDGTGLGNKGTYIGWAICNGSNGTPNLNDKFIRCHNAEAGGTGGSDSSAHTHSITHDHSSTASGTPSSTETVSLGVGAVVASSSHTHDTDISSNTVTSGAASVTENRPAFVDLVYLMRVK